MFCYQCEQTSKGIGCSALSVCGKDEQTAQLQDLLVHACKGIAQYAHRAQKLGARDRAIDIFVTEALFTTVTNVNFSADEIRDWVMRAAQVRDQARGLYEQACRDQGSPIESLQGPATWQPAPEMTGLLLQGQESSIPKRKALLGDDIVGLQELLIYGLKGTAAYADHALVLGQEDSSVYAFFHEALCLLAEGPATVEAVYGACMRCGEVNLKVMAMLDGAHTSKFGHPVPTPVRIEPLKGKAILISGHDLADLEELLKQTQGKGIHVYTHGEMLPAHGYPKLKAYPHLVGNYGGAWQDQKDEFAAFPGAILMTTNCIQEPQSSYKNRIFTSGLVAWPGVTHIKNRDFSPVIEAALAAPGFEQDGPDKTILVGFGHQTVLSVAPQVIEAVKNKSIRHFFLVGGCDGARTGRDYYTQFTELVPKDCLVLTLACGKYRFNKNDFGTVAGLPRLLDMGQCNDAYSAIQVAVALSKAFNCGVNDLPLSLVLSWYEQKAVCILLTLLYLGIKNIRLGPTLPAFVTPNVLKVLVEKFNLMPISTPEKDLQAILG
ncbi:MAG TPA: hydroxylamine reductase [Candidatus Paceibacterota bacterium]|nr:hydroxylamine reductase [Verrucomicrobiota bacterium]HRY48329.1 hydroxylamine reductase [Candidatus Paceibacterota bacterium]HRZ99905.1 hydroxylamine reductase [Candidatus Paceibacterota bacterium]